MWIAALLVGLASCADDEGGSVEPTPTTSATTPATVPVRPPELDGLVPFDGFGDGLLSITRAGTVSTHPVLIADTPEERRQGLMGVEDLDGYTGMAFQFEDEAIRSFWMRDTLIPLTVVYVDSGGAVVSSADMAPCDHGAQCPAYASEGPAQLAIEVLLGEDEGLGLVPGATVSLDPAWGTLPS